MVGVAATVPEGAPADRHPSRVGRFELGELLGSGGMGAVFAARDPVLQRRVAVKLLRSAATYQPGAHGVSEVLYNFASSANNNGSAFAFQGTGTQWYTTTQGLSMLMGRFFTITPGRP